MVGYLIFGLAFCSGMAASVFFLALVWRWVAMVILGLVFVSVILSTPYLLPAVIILFFSLGAPMMLGGEPQMWSFAAMTGFGSGFVFHQVLAGLREIYGFFRGLPSGESPGLDDHQRRGMEEALRRTPIGGDLSRTAEAEGILLEELGRPTMADHCHLRDGVKSLRVTLFSIGDLYLHLDENYDRKANAELFSQIEEEMRHSAGLFTESAEKLVAMTQAGVVDDLVARAIGEAFTARSEQMEELRQELLAQGR